MSLDQGQIFIPLETTYSIVRAIRTHFRSGETLNPAKLFESFLQVISSSLQKDDAEKAAVEAMLRSQIALTVVSKMNSKEFDRHTEDCTGVNGQIINLICEHFLMAAMTIRMQVHPESQEITCDSDKLIAAADELLRRREHSGQNFLH